ncbi:tetratricopeptide repeat protein [Pseudomonas sp. SH1-B]
MNVRIWALALFFSGLLGCGDATQALAEKAKLQALRVEASQLHDAGQSRQAIAKFEEVVSSSVATDAEKAHALRFISLGYYELGEFPRSGEYAAKAAAYYPQGSYDYLVNMADADLMQGRVADAATKLEQAHALAPRGLAANNVLGLLYLGDNGEQYSDYRKALAYNQAAFEIEPGRITEIALVRNYLALQEYEQAHVHLLDLSQRYADDGYVRKLLLQAESGLQQSDE